MYICMITSYNLLTIWQTYAYATVGLCVSVFSTDMNSSSLGARPNGFLCRHKLSSQCALHKHHNLNNLGIWQEIWQNLSEKSILFFKLFDFQVHKNDYSILKVFGIKNRFSLRRGGYTPYM